MPRESIEKGEHTYEQIQNSTPARNKLNYNKISHDKRLFIETQGAIVTLTEKLNLYEFMMAILPVHYTFFVLAIIAVGCNYNNLTNLLLVESYYFSSQNNILHKRERYLPVFC